jgi:hypothetical protein
LRRAFIAYAEADTCDVVRFGCEAGSRFLQSDLEAAEHLGFLARFLGLDCPASSTQTRERLGWQPTQPKLIADLDRSQYFEMRDAQ